MEPGRLVRLEGEASGGARARWQEVFRRYRPLLRPNRRGAGEVLDYLSGKYPAQPLSGGQTVREAAYNVQQHLRLFGTPEQQDPAGYHMVVLRIRREGPGDDLYRTQREDFREFIGRMRPVYPGAQEMPAAAFPLPILVFAELNSGYVSCEGSPRLYRELLAYQGLGPRELDNPYLVAEYVDADPDRRPGGGYTPPIIPKKIWEFCGNRCFSHSFDWQKRDGHDTIGTIWEV